jgi:macrodomain Ter protein organizer (MatP/YcbG family)
MQYYGSMEQDIKRAMIYMPQELFERVAREAKRERRSISNQVVWMIEQAFQSTERSKEERTQEIRSEQ